MVERILLLRMFKFLFYQVHLCFCSIYIDKGNVNLNVLVPLVKVSLRTHIISFIYIFYL